MASVRPGPALSDDATRRLTGVVSENVLIDRPADGVTRLTLNRPDKLNALTADLVNDLHAALDAVTLADMMDPEEMFPDRSAADRRSGASLQNV